ncbi:MAG: PBSX family phage terminase large subunit [Bacteroidales bacterium]|nr:PBSX family phage terminase large subunit [Bacteroidales bacterium]
MGKVGLEITDFNPVGFQLLRFATDPAIRLIILYGGSSSGKSYSVAQVLLMLVLLRKDNALVMRKVGASISKTIYEDFKTAAQQLGIDSLFTFSDSLKRIRHNENGCRIDFSGLDDPEKIKGISNYRWVFMDEWSEFDEADFKQVRKRLRGKEGQQIITAFNPIKETHWIKKSVIDMEKWHDVPMEVKIGKSSISPEFTSVKSLRMNERKSILNPRTKELEEHAPDSVLIQSTYLNNFWVVGSPNGTYGYYDEQCVADFEKDRLNDPDYYQVYALGEWGVIRTGSEFFASFNRGKHSRETEYDPSLPIHLSVDSNVLPYISVTYWQISLGDEIELRQIGETCAGNPNNTVRKSAKMVAEALRNLGYADKVYLHADASTRSANNIDDEKRSFHDLFISTLQAEGFEVEDKVGNKNPSVSMSGEFINAVFDGIIPNISIVIGDNCSVSIEDYMAVQKDQNGGILKTKVKNKITMQTYEEHGHLSDTFRYAVCDLLQDQFYSFSNRRKRNLYAQSGFIHFFNPDTEHEYTHRLAYAMPNVNGKFVMVSGAKCGGKWHIVGISYLDTDSTEDIKSRLVALPQSRIVIECSDAYFPFIREMRKSTSLEIRAMRENGDIDRRIAATSDYVRSSILFDTRLMADDQEYGAFMQSLLDYNKDSQSKEASAVLSGFIMFAEKSYPN